MSQAPQHFRSSEAQAICDGRFPRQSSCSIISPSLTPSVSRAVVKKEDKAGTFLAVVSQSRATGAEYGIQLVGSS